VGDDILFVSEKPIFYQAFSKGACVVRVRAQIMLRDKATDQA